jgi:hypothetical protein
MTKPVIVTYAHRPKRARKAPRKPPGGEEPTPAIVASRKPGKAVRRSEPAADDGPVSDDVKAFFARMIRPRE